MLLWCVLACGSKPELPAPSPLEALWTRYSDPTLEASPPGEGLSLRGRRALVDPSPPEARAPHEAGIAEEVGLVVVDRTASDPEPLVAYEGGRLGYGGTVTMTAFAHPEGVRIETRTYRCIPPPRDHRPVPAGTSPEDLPDERCAGTRETRLRFAEELIGVIDPEGTNDAQRAAFLAIAESTSKSARFATLGEHPPTIDDRKVLLVLSSAGLWQVHQEAIYIPRERLATSAEEVGLVVFGEAQHEPTPSVRYPDDLVGYEGTAQVTAILHPEGIVIRRASVPCVLPKPAQVATLASLLQEIRCSIPPKEIGAFVTGIPPRGPLLDEGRRSAAPGEAPAGEAPAGEAPVGKAPAEAEPEGPRGPTPEPSGSDGP